MQARADADADYHTKGPFRSTRGMEATDLTPGVNYTFRVRGVGGTDGYSD